MQVKASYTSESLLNQMRQIIYCLYQKKVTKTGQNNIMNSINLLNRMDTIFMNSKNNKTSEPDRLLHNLSNKINLKKVINMSLHQVIQKQKGDTKAINLKCQLQRGMINLNYLKDLMLYQIFKIIVSIF